MKTKTSSTQAGFAPILGQLVGAEQQISRLMPAMIDAVWSSELRRALRSALSMSEKHQQWLAAFPLENPGSDQNALQAVEKEVLATIGGPQAGGLKDLSLTLLAAKMIRHKEECYEHALIVKGTPASDDRRMLGGALSDETATGVFLQELAERFVLRHFQGGSFPFAPPSHDF